jgi:anti-sigma28 factor (negative regulator of flagellin synthesis)
MPTNGLKWAELPASSPHVDSGPAHRAPGSSDLFGDEVERARRVELFRRAVAAGTYRVDGGTIADRLLEHNAIELGENL